MFFWTMVVDAHTLDALSDLREVATNDLNKISEQIRTIRKGFKRVTDDRFLPVVSAVVGVVVYIHKGNKYKRIRFSILLIGYKFGEFSFTRKPFKYPIKKKKKNFLRR